MTSARHSKETPRWGTPSEWVEMSRTALGGVIELDPMSEAKFNTVVKANHYMTEPSEYGWPGGLMRPWDSATIFLNPAGGLVVEAWRKLVAEYEERRFRAIWIGFSVEQLNILADEARHPIDYSLLICRNRISFLTTKPKRKRTGPLLLECGHSLSKAITSWVARCQECEVDPESGDSPSHGNYVVGMGILPSVFEAAFDGRGKFSHGSYAAYCAPSSNPNQLELAL